MLDLTRYLAGPYGAMLLADMGAEVIKIEEPNGGDPIRQAGPPFVNGESAYYLSINKNKQSVVIDLRQPAGQDLFARLAEKSDVVIENYRPGVVKRLGIDYPTLAPRNPRLVYCSISGFGQTGPYRDRPAYDLIFQAMGGGISITGTEDGQLARQGLGIGDLAAGMFAAFGVASCLAERERTGKGRYLEVSALDGQIALLGYIAGYYFADGRILGPQGTGHDTMVPYGMFPAADGNVVIACFTDAFWRKLCAAIDRSEWADDPGLATIPQRRERKKEVVARLTQEFKRFTRDELLDRLYAAEVPAGPVYNVAEALNDRQVRSRGMVVDVEHPAYGPFKVTGNPIKIEGCEDAAVSPAPVLGEQTEPVLRGLLELSDAELTELAGRGVINPGPK
ncbi:MAG: CoA transferase [Chloroflexi bacterium]|nr:CoA transferase [Chloroflexota bacterium]